MQKGVLFATDFIIALVLVIFFIGSLYAFYYYKTDEVVIVKKQAGMENAMNITLNNLALGPRTCDLVTNSGIKIKKLSFCWNKSNSAVNNFGIVDYNVYIQGDVGITDQNPLPTDLTNVDYIVKDIKLMLDADGKIKKSEYLNCINTGCSLFKDVKIYVWKR